MQIDAFIADSVATAENKLYAMGAGWDRLATKQFPARHPRLGLGMIISVGYAETEQDHKVLVRLEDEDGQRLPLGGARPLPGEPDRRPTGITAAFSPGRPPSLVDGDERVVPVAVNLDGLVFESPGRYRFVLSVADKDLKYLAFRVSAAS